MYTDGGVRHHQHKGKREGVAAYIALSDDPEIARKTIPLGNTTSPRAEYAGLLEGLKWLSRMADFHGSVEIQCDSELVAKQISGFYVVRDEDIRPLYEEAVRTIQDLRNRGVSVGVSSVDREKNLAGRLLESWAKHVNL